MARGGARQGAPGRSYGNRSDLNATKPLAPTAVPGQTYGQEGRQIASQRAVPMAPPPPPAAGTPPPTPTTQQQAQPPVPGSLPAWDRPSERPDEHVMSGAPQGPGPSPTLGAAGSDTLADTLTRIASQPGVPPEVAALSAYVNSGRR